VGADSARSKPLPCGKPSMMSVNPTSQSSLSASRCAVVPPTIPAPTTVTFFRIDRLSCRSCRSGPRLHVVDDGGGVLAGLDLLGAFHQALEVVGHRLLRDGLGNALLDELRRVFPAHELEHQDARK